jgi:DNA (cytosine-5)-methyltransferase 1
MKLHYNWTLKDAVFPKNRGKVFSCFACGGGSTMGYKLAGFDVIGCNEIDPKMMSAYKANHNPKYAFLEPIQTFKNRDDLPAELFDLDILDGSPPCSSFSMAGSREDDWGKEKKFREGQANQVLDTLFFDFIDLAKRLQPKIVVAENVKGLLLGEAKDYVHRILAAFDKAGYFVRYDLLDASKMGVPQRRERVFFTAMRKDLYRGEFDDMFQTEPSLRLKFNERPVLFSEVYQPGIDDRPSSRGKMFEYWKNRERGDESFAYTIKRMEPNAPERCFANKYLYSDIVPMTYTSNSDVIYLFDEYRKPNRHESCCIGSFPQDYDFTENQYSYIIGMSVPPLMTARLADQIAIQWLGREYNCDTITEQDEGLVVDWDKLTGAAKC